jgi:CpcD/allophycocyanin linker domain
MATMSISSNLNDISNYGNRMVTITVTASNQQFMRLANQTLSVPYNRLSQAIRNIHRSGSKVVDVSMHSISAAPIAVLHSSAAAPEQQSKPEDNNPAAKKKKR